MIKKLWYKINCLCGKHKWRDMKRSVLYNYHYRICTHCGKQQYRELSPYKKVAEQGSTKWIDSTICFKTDTQKVCERAESLARTAKTLVNELSKFDSDTGEKTKTFMHLVNIAKGLSADFMKLKGDVRQLHIWKQKEDLRKEAK